ncbi:MAG: monoamine oxidase [Pirellulaceae bacterium]|nr:MAG: monoamine oxidase [Pirellulaceae bacterium]
MCELMFFEDLQPGMEWKSPGRTITEADVVSFAGLTGDYNQIHVDHEFAGTTPYGKPIAHGLLGLSYLAGLCSHYPSVRTIALVRLLDWRFERPIFIGDTIHVLSEIESCSPKGRKSGEVVWHRQLLNQRGEIVQAGRMVTLVAAREFMPRKSRARIDTGTIDDSVSEKLNGTAALPSR